MSRKIENAKVHPSLYYGMHFCPGVAEYREPKKNPYRIFLNEDTIRKMNATFQGKPVFVLHKQIDDVEDIEEEADGYVIRSFYNAADGKTWAEFLVTSDRGHKAIKDGWTLSNSYRPTEPGPAGMWNGVDYEQEIKNGIYDHLAIVPDPRYAESIVLTPEQFKAYNQAKELDLKKVANSKSNPKEKEKMGLLNLFKREKVENSADLETMVVKLTKSGKEMSLVEVCNAYDAILNMHGYANADHMVKCDEEEMTVNEMSKKYSSMKNKLDEMDKAAAAEKEGKKENEDDKDKEKKDDEKKDNSKSDADKAAAAAAKAAADEAGKKHFETIKNAHNAANSKVETVDTAINQVERGKARYGS